jgi:hypothetical protein
MLVTMQNGELIRKLMELAGGDLDLVQAAIRVKAQPGGGGADLEEVVKYIVGQRRSAASAGQVEHAE